MDGADRRRRSPIELIVRVIPRARFLRKERLPSATTGFDEGEAVEPKIPDSADLSIDSVGFLDVSKSFFSDGATSLSGNCCSRIMSLRSLISCSFSFKSFAFFSRRSFNEAFSWPPPSPCIRVLSHAFRGRLLRRKDRCNGLHWRVLNDSAHTRHSEMTTKNLKGIREAIKICIFVRPRRRSPRQQRTCNLKPQSQ